MLRACDGDRPAHLADETKEDYAFTRAIVDVAPMKEKLLKNPHLFDVREKSLILVHCVVMGKDILMG